MDMLLAVTQLFFYLLIEFPVYPKKSGRSEISEDMKGHIRTLTALFSMDSIGGGLITTSMLTLWFKAVYNVDLSTAGAIFLVVNILTAISILISSRIQNSIGLIRTMVFTHLISNGFLLFMPVVHNLLWSEDDKQFETRSKIRNYKSQIDRGSDTKGSCYAFTRNKKSNREPY